MRLTPDEFVSRFTLHLLPRQLRRMRYAGMFHAGAAKKKLPLCRELLLEHHTRAALTHASTLTASASDDGADSHRDLNATGVPDSTGDANATEPTSEELREARKRHNELQRHARAEEERREKLAELHAFRVLSTCDPALSAGKLRSVTGADRLESA